MLAGKLSPILSNNTTVAVTYETMPQWKIDLIQRKKKIQTTFGGGQQQQFIGAQNNSYSGSTHRIGPAASKCNFVYLWIMIKQFEI